MTDDRFPDLTEQLCARVREWVQRMGQRLANGDSCDVAALEITLTQPGSDEDGALVLEANIKETNVSDTIEGRVEGLVGP